MSKQNLAYKNSLYQHCIAIIKERIANSVQAVNNAQAAANSEEKSSAGDKYETSRAMSHLEKDMQGRQLASNQNELAALLGVDCSKMYSTIAAGSIVVCKEVSFFIAAGLGKILFEGSTIYLVSPNAPLIKSLAGKGIGDEIMFGSKGLTILSIF